MSPIRKRLWLLPLALAAAVVIVLPLAALTEFGVETDVKDALGIVDRCVPDTAESPGWREEPSLPDARDEPRATAAGGVIYIAGGTAELVDFGKPSSVPGVKEHVEVRVIDKLTRFDPATGRYAELPPLPVPVNHQLMVSYRGDVYAIGGHGRLLNGADPRQAFQRYSPRTDRWTRMPPMPSPRGAAGGGVIGDKLYVAGGMGRHGRVLSTLEVYDFRTRKWSRGPDMPTPREHVGSAVLDGKLYVIGGRNLSSDALAVVERYDPKRRRWVRVPSLPVPSGGLEAFAAGGELYAVGGGDDSRGTVTEAVQRFDPRRGEWRQAPRMRTPRHGYAGAVAGGRVFLFGGSPCALFASSDIAESFAVSGDGARR